MKRILAILILALLSAVSYAAQEGKIATGGTEEVSAQTTQAAEQEINVQPGEITKKSTTTPTKAEDWQTREACESATREVPILASRVSTLESKWLSLQKKVAVARRKGDVRTVRVYTDRSNAIARRLLVTKNQIIALKRGLISEIGARKSADQDLKNDLQNETYQRESADRNETTARKGDDQMLAWGILLLALVAGMGFLLSSILFSRR